MVMINKHPEIITISFTFYDNYVYDAFIFSRVLERYGEELFLALDLPVTKGEGR